MLSVGLVQIKYRDVSSINSRLRLPHTSRPWLQIFQPEHPPRFCNHRTFQSTFSYTQNNCAAFRIVFFFFFNYFASEFAKLCRLDHALQMTYRFFSFTVSQSASGHRCSCWICHKTKWTNNEKASFAKHSTDNKLQKGTHVVWCLPTIIIWPFEGEMLHHIKMMYICVALEYDLEDEKNTQKY